MPILTTASQFIKLVNLSIYWVAILKTDLHQRRILLGIFAFLFISYKTCTIGSERPLLLAGQLSGEWNRNRIVCADCVLVSAEEEIRQTRSSDIGCRGRLARRAERFL
jgi:hypothetical protein